MYFAPTSLLEKTPLADIVTKPDPIDPMPFPIDQGIKLSPAEIEKVLYLSGMTDAGRFEAIIANTDTAGLLAMFGMSYAELKEILAVPDDRLATAPEKDAQLVTDKAIADTPEYLSPYRTLPEITIVTYVENDLPISSDTAAPAEHSAQGSASLAAPSLNEEPDVALPVQPVDAGAVTDVQDVALPVQPVDASVTADGGDQQNGNPDAAFTGNVDTDGGAGNAHHDDDTEQHADAGIGADAGNAEHDNNPNPDAIAGAGTDAQHNGADDSIVANDGSVPANDAVHTPAGSDADADAQNSDEDLYDGTEQNEDDSPLVSSELLLTNPPGPGSTPPAEPPVDPPVLPPVAPPVVSPVVPTTEPVVPVTEPVLPPPVTEPVLPPSIPVSQVPQQPSAVSDPLPGSNDGGGAQTGSSSSGSTGGIKPVDEPSVFKHDAGGSSSSSSSGGFGVSASGGGGGVISGGSLDIGGVIPGIVAGGAGSLIVRSVTSGDTGISFGSSTENHDSGNHQADDEMPPTTGDTGAPPVQAPTQAPDAWQRAYDAYKQLEDQFDLLTDSAYDLWDQRYALEIRVERAQARIATIDSAMRSELQNIQSRPEIAHLTTQNDALRELIADNRAATAAAQRQATITLALGVPAKAALRNALETISEIVNQTVAHGDEQARIDQQTDIVIEQGNILHQQSVIYQTQQDTLIDLRNSLRVQESVIRENTREINRWQAENHEAMAKWNDGKDYINVLKKYIAENNNALAQNKAATTANDALRVQAYTPLDQARDLVHELSPFRNGRYQFIDDHGPVDLNDHVPTRESWDMEHDLIGKLPPAPPSYHISEATPDPSDDENGESGTGATHTTTTSGTTGVPGDGQDEEDAEQGDEENDADGDSHMGVHSNVNPALHPAVLPMPPTGNTGDIPPADSLSTNPNPADQPDVTGATHTTTTSGTTSVPTATGSHPAAGPTSFNVALDPPASHSLNVQVEMVHPSILAGSSTAVLHGDTVVHDLPIVRAIIDAWIRTLPSSAQISLQGFDILNADPAGPVTLAIQFALVSGHTVDANLDLPADAVAILKAAIQGAVAIWEQDQESAAPIVNDSAPTSSADAPEHQLVNPFQNDDHGDGTDTHAITSPAPLLSTPPMAAAAVEVPLHYGTADMMTLDSVTLWFEFKPLSGASGLADFIQRGHDIPALQGVLAHWMGSIDPGFAATVVAFQMEDYDPTSDCDFMLQVLVNDMRVIPNQATLMDLQNAMQAYLATPESPVSATPANPDGTTHQALSVVGVTGLGGLA